MKNSGRNGFGQFARAAKSAILTRGTAEISHWIGTGPSIRARARLALLVAFLIATPTLFIGVKRSEDVSKYADSLIVYDQFWERISAAQLCAERTSAALWRIEAEPEIENERELKLELDDLRTQTNAMIASKPGDFASGNLGQLQTLTSRVSDMVDSAFKPTTALSDPARFKSL